MPEPRLSVLDRGQERGAQPRRLPARGELGRRAGRGRRLRRAGTPRARSPNQMADVVIVRAVRRLCQPAQRCARGCVGRLGALDRRRRAGDAGAGGRDPAGDRRPGQSVPRIPRADPERDPGPAVWRIRERSTTFRCGCSAATAGAGSAWCTRRSSSRAPAARSRMHSGIIRSRTWRSSWTRSITTRRWRPASARRARRRFRTSDLTLRPLWTFFKLYVFKQGFRDGVEGFMFCALSGVSVAVRAWKHRELICAREGLMIADA